jgi:Spy/CpxP family protein refolding chaperone
VREVHRAGLALAVALALALAIAADPADAATPTRLGSGDNGWVHVDRQG